MSELDGLKLLRRIEEGVAGKTGDAFFRQIVCDLSGALNAHAAFTSRLLPGRRARMLAFWVGDRYETCLEYALDGTPCEFVYRGDITAYARNVGEVFPVDRAWFEQLGVRSYLGIPVKDETGAVCGHLAVMDTRERDWADADIDVLRLFSLRSAAELERTRYQTELEQANRALLEAKAEAESANQAKSVFISQMSHELRTPLNGILGFAQLLKREGDALSERVRDGLSIIERSGEHLLKLVNDLLDLARIEAGKLELSPGRVYLDELVEHVVSLARVRAQNARLTVHVVTESLPTAPVQTDERVIRQILLNLLGNAVKFTEPGGRITLEARAARREAGTHAVTFVVEDSGIGIEPAELERIFEPFHRVTRTDRTVEGTGLGLAIVQRLVTALGGTVSVTSQKGVGSRFSIECEFAPAQLPEASSLPATEIEGYEGTIRRVLVADDDSDNRTLVARLLESVGFTVQAVGDGRDALECLSEARPDLIVTDLMMPRMDGMQLVRALRGEPALAETPVIAMSASASHYTREEALRAGCSAFLSKPLALAAFLETIGQQLGLRWRYRGASPSSSTAEPSPAPLATAFRLSPELTAELQHLAKQGDIIALTARVDAALGSNDAAQSFREDVRALAARYDIRGIRQVLAASSSL